MIDFLRRVSSWLTETNNITTAIVGLAGLLAGWVRWLRRRQSPAADEDIPRVEISERNRSAFLERVWSQRISNGLDRSIEHAAEIALKLRSAPELLEESYSQFDGPPGEILSIDSAYHRAGGQLLVTGPPGSGKTTESLRLMRSLLVSARGDAMAPIPEIFPLASWAKERKPLIDWLAQELQIHHGRPRREAKSLIFHHQIVPFLDGLDEVAPEHRTACVKEINHFWEHHRGGPLIICSRRLEYEELPERLRLAGAVIVLPLEETQIDRYLAAAGQQWGRVRAELQAGRSMGLQEFLATPLTLSIAVLAYEDSDPAGLLIREETGQPSRNLLWSRYISTMLHRNASGNNRLSYSAAGAQRWLGWLAQKMHNSNETEILLHQWIGPRSLQTRVKIFLGIVGGMVAAALGYRIGGRLTAVPFGVVGGLAFALTATPDPAFRVRLDHRRLVRRLAVGLGRGMLGGVLGSLLILGLSISLTKVLIVAFAATALRALLGNYIGRKYSNGAPGNKVLWQLGIALIFSVLGALLGANDVSFSILSAFMGVIAVRSSMKSQEVDQRSSSLAFWFGVLMGLIGALGPLTGIVVDHLFHMQPMTGRQGALGIVNVLGSKLVMQESSWLDIGGIVAGAAFGAVGGLIGSTIQALIAFGPDREHIAPRFPTQIVRQSTQIGLVTGLGAGVITGLTVSLTSATGVAPMILGAQSAVLGLLVGLIAAFGLGLDSFAFSSAFRFWLRSHNAGPLRWARFLDWASSRLFLRRTAGSYTWVHLELRDFLATWYRAQGDDSRTNSASPYPDAST